MNAELENKSDDMDKIAMEKWGKDHWSLLAYVECRVVDNHGQLDPRHLSCSTRYPFGNNQMWNDKYSTRLKPDGVQIQATGHCDWDCLNDLEAEGLIEVLSLINGYVTLKPYATKFTNAIRNHKANGGVFATFADTDICLQLIKEHRETQAKEVIK